MPKLCTQYGQSVVLINFNQWVKIKKINLTVKIKKFLLQHSNFPAQSTKWSQNKLQTVP